MENHEERTLTYCNMTYKIVLRELLASTNGSQVKRLQIMNSKICTLKKCSFNNFGNLIYLNLSDCNIEHFEQHVFDHLISLNSINLSSNSISITDRNLFEKNRNLNSIILKNNLLNSLNLNTFSGLDNLEILDLSFNNIPEILEEFPNCRNLKKLYLNNNNITLILSITFNNVTNLTHLVLNNNKIGSLSDRIFTNLVNLRHLNLNDNKIDDIHVLSFFELRNLNVLYLGNNLLTGEYGERSLFSNNAELIELDLSNNVDFPISTYTFKYSHNLKILKLIVSNLFQISSVMQLHNLTELELVSKQEWFSLSYHYRDCIQDLYSLRKLKIVMQTTKEIRLCNFSKLQHLEFLHLECLEPSNRKHDFHLHKIFPNSPELYHLVLKKLNHFVLFSFYSELRYVKHLSLSGIKGVLSPHFFFNNALLEYLDLSFSEIEVIGDHIFEKLVNLVNLQLQHSKLTWIQATAFKYNRNLQILNLSHCCIDTIDNGSFLNLNQLKELDLSHNPLLVMCDSLFDGVNREICVIRL